MKIAQRFLYTLLVPFAALLLTAVVFHQSAPANLADGYGSVTGQFVFDGDFPETKYLVAQGDTKVKDPSICAAEGVIDESLVVDRETKGIEHIFVYLRSVDSVHPDLAKSEKELVEFDQKGCHFTPHAIIARTDQKVQVKSADACAHNTHTYAVRGQSVNFILKPNDREGIQVPVTTPEFLPTQVKCDIHPWMMGWWLVLDHPYAAKTGKDGKFTIEKLPAGEYEFIVWQERSGYLSGDGSRKKLDYPNGIGSKRGFTVTIKPGGTADIGTVSVPASAFEGS